MNIEADIEATLHLTHTHIGVRPAAFNSAGIRAAVQPSNLTAPTRLSEKYAPDSCVTGLELKYVYADRDLLSAKPRELVLRQVGEEGEKVREGEGGKAAYLGVKPMIPGLILYERPSWNRSEALESLLKTSVPQSLASTVPHISPEPPKPKPTKAIQAPRPAKSSVPKEKTIKRVKVQIAQPMPSDSVTRPEPATKPVPQYIPAPKKLHGNKGKKKEKTQKMYPASKLNVESVGSVSISDQFALSDSINRWSEAKLSSSILKEKDDFSPTKSGSQGENSPENRYEDARTTKHVHYQDDSAASSHHRPEESIRQLEEMVAEQHRYLVDHGYLSPQSSSLAASKQKTYEDLEREIDNIKEMLGEGREQRGSAEEESGSQLTYSSDEGEEEAEEEGEEWMSPRFTE